MILLDAQAVLAFLKDEYGAAQVEQLIEREDGKRLTLLGVSEVIDHLVRVSGIPEDEAIASLADLPLASPPPIDIELARQAGLLRARHYHRRTRAISLADCVAAETARRLGASLATADPALLDTCAAEGIAVIPLPDSQGDVWAR